MSRVRTLALDLEGTLISNAMSQFPRPGLRAFLEACAQAVDRVVVFTAVSEERSRSICEALATEGSAPPWFAAVEHVRWQGPVKDLAFIAGSSPDEVLLVEDLEDYVHPDQRDRWVPIPTWETPYPEDDRALEEILPGLLERLASAPDGGSSHGRRLANAKGGP